MSKKDILEVSGQALSPEIFDALTSGAVVILRDCPSLHRFRGKLLDAIDPSESNTTRAAIVDFYDQSVILDNESLRRLTRVIKELRKDLVLSDCLAPMIREMACPADVLLDGGINRLVVPPAQLAALKDDSGFVAEDFARKSADGEVEVFMPAPANVHRDFNRPHYLFQFNIWFPMHAAGPGEVLRIWPHLYRNAVTDHDPTPDAFQALGPPLSYRLAFGDCILFHGEHLHTSPGDQLKSPDYRRHSYDVRVATHAPDDNAHYRQNFWNLKNFPAGDAPEDATKNAIVSPFHRIVQLSSENGVQNDDIQAIFTEFQTFEYCDDRYLLLLKQAIKHGNFDLIVDILGLMRARSRLPAHLIQAATLTAKLAPQSETIALLTAAQTLSSTQGEYKSFAPIAYSKPATQPRLEDYRQFCERHLAPLGASIQPAQKPLG